MNCRPLRWLWGLLPLALIAFFINNFIRPVIEADLSLRSASALQEAGLPWAGISFEGRDGILSGLAYDEGARGKAMNIVARTSGVRIVDDRAKLIDHTENFYWMATREDSRIRLKGFVPNEELRKTIIGMASASFPGLEIDDRMKLARGGPPEDAWLGGVNFGFKQLGRLKSGRARLDADEFTISGEAANIESYKKIDKELNERIPGGITLKRRHVLAPKVSPFIWSADIHGRKLFLRGYVPSSKTRAALLTAANSKFPNLKVVDQLTIAGGAPKEWLKGTRLAMAALKRVGNGRASLSDKYLSLTGSTKDAVLPGSIDNLLASGLPKGFAKKVAIAVIKPKLLKLNWRAVLNKSSIILEGEVPDRAVQKRLVDRARMHFPGRRVVNRMNIKSGVAPTGWGDAASRSIEVMTRLEEGEAILNDRRLRISGVALDSNSVEVIRETVSSYLPSGFSGFEFVKPPSPVFDRYNFTETEEDGDSYWQSQLDNSRKKDAQRAADEKKLSAQALEIAAARKAAGEAEAAKKRADLAAKKQAELAAKKQAELAAKKQAELAAKKQAELAAKKATAANSCETSLNKIVKTGIVRFKTNSSTIQSDSFPTLKKLAKVARSCPKAAFEISGHTDSDGSASYNQKLSLKRAKSITSYLVKQGVAGARLTSAGYGETRPIAPNDTPANKAMNRRIEFKISAK